MYTSNQDKTCKCGKKPIILVDNAAWLCGDCAIKAAISNLGCGVAVISISNGIARMSIWARQANNDSKG